MFTAPRRLTANLGHLVLYVGAALPLLATLGAMADETRNAVADPNAVVVSGQARFTVLTPGLVRIEWSPDGTFEDRASQVVVNRRLPVPKFTKCMERDLRISTQPAAFTAPPQKTPTDVSGNVLVLRTDRIEIRHLQDGQPLTSSNLIVAARVGPDETWQVTAPPFPQCRNVHGGPNLGSTVRTLDGVNGSAPLPDGILSRTGWYHLNDSNTLVFDDGPDPWIGPRRRDGATDWYFFAYGTDYKQALRDFTAVAGRIPLPPRFVFGTWWSRYWAYSDRELTQLVNDFDLHDVPLDVLVIDMDWHLDGWTGYTWNPQYFPEPEKFLRWVKSRGLKATLNLHPAEGVGKHEKAFPQVAQAMGLDPATTDRVPFDCASREYMTAYFRYLHHPLEKMGIDFWWMDWQQGQQTNIEGLDPLYWLNVLHWRDMKNREPETGRRPLIFSRWGGLGNHRYQIGFSGDTFCNWPSLAFQPYFTATAGNVGYAYWSHDIGGHQPGKVDPELYTRWVQWGAFSPILRTHTTKNSEAERRIWEFPTPYFEAMRAAFHLRYELIPYIYTAARQCYDTALPLCRPLYYEWPELDEAYTWKNQYLFGEQLMVAPVTQPADPLTGCAMVEAWIPPGKWTNWFTGRTYDGPAVVPLVVPLDEIPVFVRDGGIVVTQKKSLRSDGAKDQPLVINIFPGAAGEYTHYEDDGTSDGYLRGKYATQRIRHTTAGRTKLCTIEAPQGTYPSMPNRPGLEIRWWDIEPFEKLTIDGREIERADQPRPGKTCWGWDLARMSASLHIAAADLHYPVQVSAALPEQDGNVAAFLRDGGRGMSRLYNEVRISLKKNKVAIPDGALATDPESKALAGTLTGTMMELMGWKGWIDLVAGKIEDTTERNRLLLRMLGVWYAIDVARSPDGKRAEAIIKLQSTIPHPDLQLSLEQAPDGGTQRLSTQLRRFESEGEPLIARVPLEAADSLATQLVRFNARVAWEDTKVTFEIARTILPSINAWWVCGPFDAPGGAGLPKPFGPEEKFDLAARYPGKDGREIGWHRFQRTVKPGDNLTDEFFVDFDDVYGRRVYDCVVYGFTYLDAPEDMDAVLALGTDDGCAIWLNGKEVHRIDIGRPYTAKQDRVPVRLKQGENTLLIKVSQGGGDGGFGVHIEDSQGRALTQVRPRLDPRSPDSNPRP